MSSYDSQSSSFNSRSKAKTFFGSRTDVGCVREHNEDSLIVAPPLFAVADGMGGHAAGDVASEIAVNTLIELAPKHADPEALGRAVCAVNEAVIKSSTEHAEQEGMGTTITAALLEGEKLVIAQVGDSRAYLLHQGTLQQITRDHSLMADMIEAGQLTPEEARVHPHRSVITRALGSDPYMVPDLYEFNVESGDRLLLCSDGLSSMITDDGIEDTLSRIEDPQRAADALVDQAIQAGGHDNVTVIVVNISGFGELREKKRNRKVRLSTLLIIIALVAVIGAAASGLFYYSNNAVFLGDSGGYVAVYRGIPGSFFGVEASRLDYVSDVKISALQPGVASRLEEGIRVDSLDEANMLIGEYRAEAQSGSQTPAAQTARKTAQTVSFSQHGAGHPFPSDGDYSWLNET